MAVQVERGGRVIGIPMGMEVREHQGISLGDDFGGELTKPISLIILTSKSNPFIQDKSIVPTSFTGKYAHELTNISSSHQSS